MFHPRLEVGQRARTALTSPDRRRRLPVLRGRRRAQRVQRSRRGRGGWRARTRPLAPSAKLRRRAAVHHGSLSTSIVANCSDTPKSCRATRMASEVVFEGRRTPPGRPGWPPGFSSVPVLQEFTISRARRWGCLLQPDHASHGALAARSYRQGHVLGGTRGGQAACRISRARHLEIVVGR